MDNFRTELQVTPSKPFRHGTRILTSGSCFADHLGNRLKTNKFPCEVNPFGIAYSPLALHTQLQMSMSAGTSVNRDLFVRSEDTWRHLMFHSRWAHADLPTLQLLLENQLQQVGRWLHQADVIVLTYGTAWAYRHLATGQWVANCHKLPAQTFEKTLVSPGQIVESFDAFYHKIQQLRPGVRFIVTVSPVRHLRDTLELNQVSKATLRLACHHICRQYAQVEYFPAYEILMDDLRDYRFYEPDMIHPNRVAIDYIWKKFTDRYFDTHTRSLIDKIASIRQAMEHRPFHPTSASHQTFLQSLLVRLHGLNTELDVQEEINQVKAQLI
jgi:hypothetical protein